MKLLNIVRTDKTWGSLKKNLIHELRTNHHRSLLIKLLKAEAECECDSCFVRGQTTVIVGTASCARHVGGCGFSASSPFHAAATSCCCLELLPLQKHHHVPSARAATLRREKRIFANTYFNQPKFGNFETCCVFRARFALDDDDAIKSCCHVNFALFSPEIARRYLNTH